METITNKLRAVKGQTKSNETNELKPRVCKDSSSKRSSDKESGTKTNVMVQKSLMSCTKEDVYDTGILLRCKPDLLSECPKCTSTDNRHSRCLTDQENYKHYTKNMPDLRSECSKITRKGRKSLLALIATTLLIGTTCAITSYYKKINK